MIEPALGLNRLMMAIFSDGLVKEPVPASAAAAASAAAPASGSGAATAPAPAASADREPAADVRTVFKVHPGLAPIKFAVLPLHKKDEQVSVAETLQSKLLKFGATDVDVTQSIGKRYRRQDEIGTPLCITVDPQTLVDGTVTVRDRDTMRQIRLHADEVVSRAQQGRLLPSA